MKLAFSSSEAFALEGLASESGRGHAFLNAPPRLMKHELAKALASQSRETNSRR